MLNAEEFALQMREFETKYGTDREALHSEMDKLMCEVLKSHGYTKGVEIFEKADIWYC